MKIKTLLPNKYFSNTFVIGDEGEPCIVVDPGYFCDDNFDIYIEKHHKGQCLGVLITHTHFDHIGGLSNSKIFKKCPIYVGFDDVDGFDDKSLNLVSWFTEEKIKFNIDPITVSDGEIITLGNCEFKVIHTPFHTKGSVCYYLKSENSLFSGDTLFNKSIGRTDLKGSCPRFTEQSLAKLAKLPNETKVFPGHGFYTSIGYEKEFGYLKGIN